MNNEFIFRCWNINTGKRIDVNKKPLKHYYYELEHLSTGKIFSSTDNICNNSFLIYEELINKFLNI